MTALPEGLAAWRPLLAMFDASVVAALAPMLDRLARAIGPMSPEASEPTGDPSGYDGVAARGPYERLLPSEWLLADELPDEFMRRAIASEHLFFALARERPRGRRALTVLVDMGPELFGTPRIATLASLLVLAQRAKAANASFGWRAVQTADEELTDVQPAGVRTFLGACAVAPLEGDMLGDAARRELAQGELWVVANGRGARAATAHGASSVAIDDVLELTARELVIRVHTPGRPERAVRLPLPDDAACVRLLRDPFPRQAPPTVQPGRVRAQLAIARPVISPGHPSCFARLEDGGLLVLPLPRSKRQNIGRGRILRLDNAGEIIAAGHVRGKSALIAQNGYDLTFASWHRKKDGVLRRLGLCNEGLRPPPLDGRLFPLRPAGESILFQGRGGRLLEFRPGKRVGVLAQDCRALVGSGGSLVFADACGDSATRLYVLRGKFDPTAPPRIWVELRTGDALLAPTTLGSIACAYAESDGSWTAATLDVPTDFERTPERIPVFDPNAPGAGVRVVRIEVPSGAEVVGLLDHRSLDPRQPGGPRHAISMPALLLLEDEGRRLRVTSGGRGPEFSVMLPVRVEHVVVDAMTRVAVCVSSTAELILVALEWRAIFARLTSAGLATGE